MARSLHLLAVAPVALAILAGCQTSSPCDNTSSSNRVVAANQVLSCLNSLNKTTPAQMPTSGTATYNGFVTGQFDPTASTSDDILGDATLTANFNPGVKSVTGTMSNFTSTNGGAMTGTLSLTGGNIATNTFTGNVSGTLGYAGDTVTISSAPASGIFLGNKAQGMLAGFSGTATMGAGHVGTLDAVIAALK